MSTLKKYLPDIILFIGIFLVAKDYLYKCTLAVDSIGSLQICSGAGQIAGILLVTLALDIFLRRYIVAKRM